MWVVPASDCAVPYISDKRKLPGEKKNGESRRSSPRNANVELRDAVRRFIPHYGMQEILQVVTLRNIKIDEELFVDSGMKCLFQ